MFVMRMMQPMHQMIEIILVEKDAQILSIFCLTCLTSRQIAILPKSMDAKESGLLTCK